MKTSALICQIVKNENGLKHSALLTYIEELTKLGFLAYNSETQSIELTEKGVNYLEKT